MQPPAGPQAAQPDAGQKLPPLPPKYSKTHLSEVVKLSDPTDPFDGKFMTVLRLTRDSQRDAKATVSLNFLKIQEFFPLFTGSHFCFDRFFFSLRSGSHRGMQETNLRLFIGRQKKLATEIDHEPDRSQSFSGFQAVCRCVSLK